MKYRKKPVEIEAWQYLDKNQRTIPGWLIMHNYDLDGDVILIKTLEGTMRANPGDWIIKGVKGELYPVKDDIFAATYEPA